MDQESDLTRLYRSESGEKYSPDPDFLKQLAGKVKDLPPSEGMDIIEKELKKERVRTLSIAEGDKVAEQLLTTRDRSRSKSLPHAFKKVSRTLSKKTIPPPTNTPHTIIHPYHIQNPSSPPLSTHPKKNLNVSEPSDFRKETDLTGYLTRTSSDPSNIHTTYKSNQLEKKKK